MSLWELVKGENCSSLAISGLAKNTGKTVALNYLVQAAGQEGMNIGITSIGRDGEMWDVLSHKQKPAIKIEAGMLLATAEKTIPAAAAELVLIKRTGLDTPLGEVVIMQARSPGRVELAGPSRLKQLVAVIEELKTAGARMALVDGALDRQSFAAPRVTEACILATGAILGDTMEEVVSITRERVKRFRFPAASMNLNAYYRRGEVAIISEDGVRTFPSSTVMTRGKDFWERLGPVSGVVFGGALIDSTLEAIISSGKADQGLTLVLEDATRIFARSTLIDKFIEGGGRIEVLEPMQLLALTVNPTSPEGKDFDSLEFYHRIREAVPEAPVYDLIRNYGF